jgi:redox-sensitive bicupin YhaK (pirin superfamily)
MDKTIISISPLGFPWETQDPFLFCAYHKDFYPIGNGQMGVRAEALKGRYIGQDFVVKDGFRMYHGKQIPGFPYHPHRGFETITINKKGVVDHSDSLGAAGRFMGGDVQWMTAGKGIQHSEMFPMINDTESNELEIFQIWLNLPKVSKFVPPHFKMLWKEDIPVVETTNEKGGKVKADLVAGELEGKKALAPTPDSWAANPANHVRVFTLSLDAATEWTLAAGQAGISRTFYFYEGDSILIEDLALRQGHLIKLNPEKPVTIKNTGEKPAKFLVLEGRPIGEPVAQHGPFVMNTFEEIRQAIDDYQRTQFGGWPWKEQEKVHAKEKGRFALHADGKEETRPA